MTQSIRGRSAGRLLLAAAASLTLLACSRAPEATQASIPSELAVAADQIAIQNMLARYYSQLGAGRHDFGDYFADEGVIDVNGQVARGREEIEQLYVRTAEGNTGRTGRFHMLLSNLRIEVDGDTATADMIWTGIINESLTAPPKFVEQGREHDELVRRDGRWLFTNRIVTSDGGMPEGLLDVYVER